MTGKEHFNVLVDVRKMLEDLEEDGLKVQGIYLDAYGREKPCFNMAKAAKAFGKDVFEFQRLPSTASYCGALANTGKIPELIQTICGRTGSTWAHPKLAIRFAQWLDEANARSEGWSSAEGLESVFAYRRGLGIP